MSPSFGHGSRSPRSGSLPSQVPGRGPVPKFQPIKSVQELHPRVHTQPAYRRANPEGGFISVRIPRTFHISFKAHPFHLLATPSFNVPPPIHLPYLQPGFQLRVLEESSPRFNQAKQGSEE